MKPLLFTIIILTLALSVKSQNIGFNDNSADPNASAMVDINSSSKGLLIPRVSLDSTLLATPVTDPATSLMVYNTATVHDVTPGYYYWDGDEWVRFGSGDGQGTVVNLVTKSADATLTKSENMVVATAGITLTLPVVTAADNGLEIVVKNAGTYTDLVFIKAQSGKKIDDADSSRLTRWQGKSFVAYNSNWVTKNPDRSTDNLLEVSATGSWHTIQEVFECLELHMCGPAVVRLGAGYYDIPSTINIDLPYPVTLQGLSFGETIINCPDGDTAFTVSSECYFKMLDFEGESTGTGIVLNGENIYCEIKDFYMNGFNKGVVISNPNNLWMFEADFEDCSTGIEIDAGQTDQTIFKISETDFTNCDKGIYMKSAGQLTEVTVMNATFYNTTGSQVGIDYVPTTGSNNFRFNSMIISNNSFNTTGYFWSGFDFSRADGRDAKVFMENNAGVPSERPHVHVSVLNNGTNTSLASANTFYKANISESSQTSDNTKWDCATDTTNRVRYLPVNSRDAVAFISGNISNRNNNNRTANIAIVKNGNGSVRYGTTTVYMATINQSYPFSTVVYLPDVMKNDYFELWVSSTSSSDQVRIDDMNWFVDTH